MQVPELSGLLVRPLAERVSEWLDAGKLDADDLDRILTPNACSLVEAGAECMDWVPLEDAEALVALISEQVGGGPGLVEWAETIVDRWLSDSPFAETANAAQGLIDAAGYAASQSSEKLIRNADWRLEAGRDRFSFRVLGLESMSSDLKTLLGALLSRLAEGADRGFDDLRFDGVDGGELRVFGERPAVDEMDDAGLSRLLRAALIA